ncbi:MAG TPA: S41 family peptidase [Kiloniellales bacterium]|nr:S41 family peptidase [Kiloniellales bacterium]
MNRAQHAVTPNAKRGLPRRVAALSVAFFMVACATQDSEPPATADLSQADRLFRTGYQDVADIYIEEISIAELATAGLANLDELDPEASVERINGHVDFRLKGIQVAEFVAPGASDADGWGSLTASVLRIGQSRSETMREAPPERLYEVVFDGMLTELDDFSRYAGREEARENRASRDGFGGIGVRIRLVEDGVRVLSVMEDTPAQSAGLENDDIIVAIDGEDTVGLTQREVVRRLRGPLRSEVDLTVKRGEPAETLVVSIVRAHIVPQTVRYERSGDVAILRVSGFNQSTARSLREKIKHAQDEIGPQLAGYVIDLRGNPGGLLDQAVAVSDFFLEAGRIVSTHGRHPDSHQYFDAEPDDLIGDRPVALLINGNSASASEIVAAALQDSGRAVVIGSGSFGKGTVQTVLRLPNEGELTLTWARFHAPSGYALNRRGILPDLCTSNGVEDSEEILDRLRKGLLPPPRATQQIDIAADDEAGIKTLRAYCPARQVESVLDLEVATRLLEDPTLFARAVGDDAAPDTARLAPQSRAVAHSP